MSAYFFISSLDLSDLIFLASMFACILSSAKAPPVFLESWSALFWAMLIVLRSSFVSAPFDARMSSKPSRYLASLRLPAALAARNSTSFPATLLDSTAAAATLRTVGATSFVVFAISGATSATPFDAFAIALAIMFARSLSKPFGRGAIIFCPCFSFLAPFGIWGNSTLFP